MGECTDNLTVLNCLQGIRKVGGQMAERLGSRAIRQKVVGLIPGCAK